MKAVSLILTRLTFFFKFPRISCTNLATSTLKFKLREQLENLLETRPAEVSVFFRPLHKDFHMKENKISLQDRQIKHCLAICILFHIKQLANV